MKLSTLCFFLLPALSPAFKHKTPLSLQWAICDTSPSAVLGKLSYSINRPPHKIQNISYFDLFPPQYTAQGLAFRTKLHKHVPVSMVKARFANETDDVPEGAECKWDRYGNASWFTCGLSSPRVEGKALWSAEQVAFASRYHSVQWDQLVSYGPFLNPKWKFRILGKKAVFDSVEAVVDGQVIHLMEVEVGVKGKRVRKEKGLYEAITKFLVDSGVAICSAPQLPKTLRLFEALRLERQRGEDRYEDYDQRPLV